MVIDRTSSKGRFVVAALDLAAERPWSDVSLRDIAERAGSNLVELRREFASKGDILAAFTRAIDDAVLAAAPARQSSQPARDVLFDVVMARFDALAPYRKALRSIVHSGAFDVRHACGMMASQRWMLSAAGIDSSGPGGAVRAAGLGAVYASAFRTWLDDDDPGLARTMAVLDRRLRRGERSLEAVGSIKQSVCKVAAVFRGGRGGEPKPASAPPAASQPTSPPEGYAV